MKKKSNWQKRIYRELPVVGWECEAVSEWASEGSFERREQGLPVGADGTPPVIHRGTYDGTCKRVDISIRTVNLGGIAEVYAFVPYMGQKRFSIPHLPPNPKIS